MLWREIPLLKITLDSTQKINLTLNICISHFIKQLLAYYKLHSVRAEVPKIQCDLTHLPEGPLGYKIKFGTPGLHPSAGCSAEFQSRGGREGGRDRERERGGESAGLSSPRLGTVDSSAILTV